MDRASEDTVTPPRYAFRLEDPRSWHVVTAVCVRCRHRSVIEHRALKRGRPAYTGLVDLQRKLRCRRCGARGGHDLTVDARPRD
jgi:hypothetical protein